MKGASEHREATARPPPCSAGPSSCWPDGRHSATNTADASTVSEAYAYDAPGGEGRLASVVTGDRTMRWTYDPAGRVATESLEVAGVATPLVTEYLYDQDGNVREVHYPSGLGLAYTRDPATQEVTRVTNLSDGTAYADEATRLPAGPVEWLRFGNGLTLSQGFNARYEPASVVTGPVALQYAMSPAGDVEGIDDGVQPRTFEHDFLDRLVKSPGWLGYGYDGNGNRTSESLGGAAFTYAYTNDKVTKQLSAAGVATLAFAYDQQGQVSAIGRYNAAGTAVVAAMCLRHDPFGRVVLVGTTGAIAAGGTACLTDAKVTSAKARFKYDHANRRQGRWLSSTNEWTYVVSDASGNPLSEVALSATTPATWTKVRDYVWLDGRPVAQVEYGSGGAQGRPYYVHVDHIGLPRGLTNEAGQVVWSAAARPYGDLEETTTVDPLSGRTVVTNLRLPGQYDERLLGSVGAQGPYYNWNRWYLPGAGRYLELDPIAMKGDMNGFGAPDWYNYALANPLTYTDPNGENPVAGAAIGAPICGPPCMIIGALAGLGAAAVLGKIGADIICRAPPRLPDNRSCEEHRLACIAHGKVSVFYCDQCARICEFSGDKQWPWNKPGGFCQYE